MTDRLSSINESLSRKLAARNEFDNTIQETEAAYMKVRVVLHVVAIVPCAPPPTHTHVRTRAPVPGQLPCFCGCRWGPWRRSVLTDACVWCMNDCMAGCVCVRLWVVRRDTARGATRHLQILESSQTLLHVLKRESVNLAKKKQTSS